MAVFAIYNLKFSSLSARTAHMPELRSGIVTTLLEYTRRSPSPCKHGCHFFLYILIAVRAKKERRQINSAIALFKKYEGEKMFSLLHHNTTYFVIC